MMSVMWVSVQFVVDLFGVLLMEVLQVGFWQFDLVCMVVKYECFFDLFFDVVVVFVWLEDWVNVGVFMFYVVVCVFYIDCIVDDLFGSGCWQVGGVCVDLFVLVCLIVEFVLFIDCIVFVVIVIGWFDCCDFVFGYVGMIVGGCVCDQFWYLLVNWIVRFG